MAGLALTSVMYGVEKIPDTWFDKIPFYQSEEAKKSKKHAKRGKKEHQRRRNASVDEKHYEDDLGRKSGDRRRRRRSLDDEESYSDDDYGKGRNSRRDTGDDGRQRYDGAASGNYAQPRLYHAGEYPVNQANLPRQPPPGAYNNAAYPPAQVPVEAPMGAPAQMPVGSPAYNGYPPQHRSSSGPVSAQGYIPYSEIYNGTPTQPNFPSDQYHSNRSSMSRGSVPYNGVPPPAQSRQPYVDEPRGYDGRRRDSRYESDSYGSDDSHRHRRRHRSRSDSRDRARHSRRSGRSDRK